MILDTTNKQRLHVVLAGDAAEVRPYPLLDAPVNPRFAIFRAEGDVIVQRCEGVGHARTITQIAAKHDRKMVSWTKCVNEALSGADEIGAIVAQAGQPLRYGRCTQAFSSGRLVTFIF